MSSESTVNKFRKTKYTIFGPIIGASIALLLSELGFEVAMAVGYILHKPLAAFLLRGDFLF